MDLASRLASEVVRGASVGLCTGDGPFDLLPGEFANRFLGTCKIKARLNCLNVRGPPEWWFPDRFLLMPWCTCGPAGRRGSQR